MATELCSICGGNGFVHPAKADGTIDWGEIVPCHCQENKLSEERANRYLKYCALPAESEKMTLKSFEVGVNKELKRALEYADALSNEIDGVKWLTLCGPTGCGKTHLAVGVCHKWLARGKVARYGFVPLLLKELRDGYELMGEYSYRNRFEALCQIPLLVLDDLGVEKASEWAQEQLQTVVHYRGFYGLPLVVTTNRPLDQLKGDAEGRIASRLKRETWCRVVNITAPEYKQ
jgi:DNA replication protein DnaC